MEALTPSLTGCCDAHAADPAKPTGNPFQFTIAVGPAKVKTDFRPAAQGHSILTRRPQCGRLQPRRQRNPGFATATPDYALPEPGFATATPDYALPEPGFATAKLGYALPEPGFATAKPDYALPEPGFATAKAGYALAEPGFATATPGYALAEPGPL